MSSKGKQKKNANNKTSSGTGKNTALLGVNNNTETKKGGKKSKEEALKELEAKTKELGEQLDKINTDIETERHLLTEESNQLNKDITNKNFEISNLSSDNKFLNDQLKEIKANLDNKMKIGKVFLTKMELLKKTEAKLRKDIEVKQKELILAQKSRQIIISDYNRIKAVEENINEEKESILNKELETLENKKAKLEKENMDLKEIIKEHKLCKKSKTNLTSELNVLTNAYEFEKKKLIMMDSDVDKLKEKKEKIKRENDEKNNQSNRSISYGTQLKEKVLLKMKKKNSERIIIPRRAALQIANICNNIGDEYKKKAGDIKNINNNNYKLRQNTLFTENEQLQLANIMPTMFLNEFKERFEAIENQRYELVDKLKNTQDEHAKNVNSVKIKLNYNELKKKEQQLKFVGLNSHLTKKNVNITQLRENINKVIKDYNTWNKLLKMKNNENKRLNQYIDNIKNQKDNNKNSNKNINKNKSAEEEQTNKMGKKI
jgi:chromosome segregation ATPase